MFIPRRESMTSEHTNMSHKASCGFLEKKYQQVRRSESLEETFHLILNSITELTVTDLMYGPKPAITDFSATISCEHIDIQPFKLMW